MKTIRLIALFGVAIALLVGALYAADIKPLEAASGLIKGSLGGANQITGTLREMTPLLLAGVAVFLALRAGLFNIGVEGQFLVGACACAGIALKFPGIPGIILGTLGGMAAGALWALPAGLIKAYRGGHEVITTIMLNNIAALLTTALVAGPLKSATDESPTTADIAERTQLPNLMQHTFHQPDGGQSTLVISSALVIGAVVVLALWWWLRSTVSGYELRAVGANPTAARFAGIAAEKVTVRAMAWSGSIGGLAGAFQVLAFEHRFFSGFSPGYGFDALGVALLAGNSPIGLLPSSFLFGILAKGGTSIQVLGVPKGITSVLLGLLIIIAAVIRYRKAGEAHG